MTDEEPRQRHYIHLHNSLPRSSSADILSRLNEDNKNGIPVEREYVFDLGSIDLTIRVSESVHSRMREAAAVARGVERGRSLLKPRRRAVVQKRRRTRTRRPSTHTSAPKTPKQSDDDILLRLVNLSPESEQSK